jgi:hypothetical protein
MNKIDTKIIECKISSHELFEVWIYDRRRPEGARFVGYHVAANQPELQMSSVF